MADKIEILNIGVSNVDYDDVLEKVEKWLEKGAGKHQIVTPNPEILMNAQSNPAFSKVLNEADLALPDGVGLLWAGRILGKPLKARVTGVDVMEKLCGMAEERGFRVGLIGGKQGVAIKAADCLKKRYPKLKVLVAREEWDEKARGVIDILFVAFGAPKQELWIKENLGRLPVRVAMGVGGAFDYLSGEIPRAPLWIRNLGFEWLLRSIRQPWRLRRQMALFQFAFLILKERYCAWRKVS